MTRIKPIHSHSNLFFAANRIEIRLKRWLKNPEPQSLFDVYWSDIPDFRRSDTLTFGTFIDELAKIAAKYGCKITSPDDTSRSVSITGKDAYSMALDFVFAAMVSLSSGVRAIQHVAPAVQEIASMVEQWADFDHPPLGQDLDAEEAFVYHARLAMAHSLNNPDLLDTTKAIAKAAQLEARLQSKFSQVPGQFGSALLNTAIVIAGTSYGDKQAENLLAKSSRSLMLQMDD
jgi:hypothetical protein